MGIFLRWLFAFALLTATFNPTPFNYVRWVQDNRTANLSLTVFFGLLLFIGYVVYLSATLRSIGSFGVAMVIAVFASLIWVLHDQGILLLTNYTLNLWLGIFALSLVLGVGLSWSIVHRALTGQIDVDEHEG
ncbi:MAG: hypothetical protein KGH84_01240 [Paracoccaceae bacterium]|nr:hypothetical protein [Paracoccaceae bacterium]